MVEGGRLELVADAVQHFPQSSALLLGLPSSLYFGFRKIICFFFEGFSVSSDKLLFTHGAKQEAPSCLSVNLAAVTSLSWHFALGPCMLACFSGGHAVPASQGAPGRAFLQRGREMISGLDVLNFSASCHMMDVRLCSLADWWCSKNQKQVESIRMPAIY